MIASSPLPAAILQGGTTAEETTVSIAEAAGKAVQEIPGETGTVLGGVRDFFKGIAGYLTSPEFIANIVATVIIIVPAIVLYRIAVHLIPRILQWRRPEDDTLSPAALASIKR